MPFIYQTLIQDVPVSRLIGARLNRPEDRVPVHIHHEDPLHGLVNVRPGTNINRSSTTYIQKTSCSIDFGYVTAIPLSSQQTRLNGTLCDSFLGLCMRREDADDEMVLRRRLVVFFSVA